MPSEKLTDEQIKYWRKTLAVWAGPTAAGLATPEDIQGFRDRMQDWIDTGFGDGPEAERERRSGDAC